MRYADRNGNITDDHSLQDRLLGLLYRHAAGRFLLKPFVRPGFSRFMGRLLDSRLSSLLVPLAVRAGQIDLSPCEKQTFSSYNDFFTRRLKSAPCPPPEALISPCDSRLSVYPIDEDSRFVLKHTTYTVASLLRSEKLARRFRGGFALIFRLTVGDYHRYCFMDDGRLSNTRRIPGFLHTVNPAANDALPIYKENTREYCLLRSRRFKTMLLMEVGALMVGKIVNYPHGPLVCRGEEKGRFEFGGSTIVVLLQRDSAIPDPDLIANTQNGLETIVHIGEPIGLPHKTTDLPPKAPHSPAQC